MNYKLIFFLITLVFVFSANKAFSANWRFETLDSSPEVQWNTHVTITLDKEGSPHVVYGEKTIDYGYLDKNGWHKERIASMSTFGQAWPSIAIDSNGKAHIVYDNHEISRLTYVTNASGQWVSQTLNFDGFWPEIVVDSQNTPHIVANVYYESTGPFFDPYHGTFIAHHITNSSGTWTKERVGGKGEDFKIAIDDSGKLHIVFISYGEYPDVQASVSYSSNKSGFWNYGIFSDEGNYNNLKLWQVYFDLNGTLQLIYQKTHNTRFYPGSCYGDCYYTDFKHASNTSGSWQVATVETTNHFGGFGDTIPPGKIQYFGLSEENLITEYDYLFINGNGYVLNGAHIMENSNTETIIQQGASIRWFDAISDLSGNLYIFYYDETNNNFNYATNSPLVKGDINADSMVNLQDVIQLLKILTATEQNQPLSTDADVNLDNKLGVEEMIYILQKSAGMRSNSDANY